jgi:predicted RNA polymerase sigma factor
MKQYPLTRSRCAHSTTVRRTESAWIWTASTWRSTARCVATLTRLLGDIGLAEEAVKDAQAPDRQKWEETPPTRRVVVTTARNRTIDRLRRESTRDARALLHQPDEPKECGDQLRMVFTCCHPALSPLTHTGRTRAQLAGERHEVRARSRRRW